MRKTLMALAIAMFALLSLLAPARGEATVAAPTEVQTAQVGPDLANYRYQLRYICVVDGIGNPDAWDVGWTANSWESGDDTVVTGYRTLAQGCNDYPAHQRLRVYLYSAGDGKCGKITGDWDPATNPENGNYDFIWNAAGGGPAIWINQWYWEGCRDTATIRSHMLAGFMGQVWGLKHWTDCSAPYSVMNKCWWSAYNIAGAWPVDRNAAWEMYHPD